MKRSVKIASALVVLVLMLAQVIGVSAAVVTTYTPTFSTEIDKTGLTVTADTITGASACKIYVNNNEYTGWSKKIDMGVLNNYNYIYCMVTVDNRNFTSGTSTVDLSQPAIYYNVDQTDHFQKTVTASGRGGVGVKTIRIDGYKNVNGGNQDDSYTTGTVKVNGANMTVSLDIRPEYIKSVKITVVDMLDRTITQVVNTGENGYYNPGSGSNTGSSGVWDGTFKDNTSSGSDNTNGWTGYYDDSSKDYTTYYVTCRTLNVRKSDSARSTKVGTLRRNAKVHVYNIQDGWAVIDYKGNLRYVSARYLSR